jgi:vacuolar-type H+-ATPase subunit H
MPTKHLKHPSIEISYTQTLMLTENSTAGNKLNGNQNGSALSRADYYMSLHKELDQLEEMVLESGPRVMGHTVVDEEKLCQQIDRVRLSVPESIAEAEEILMYKQQLIDEAQQYADNLVKSAELRAGQLLEESVIIRQAEQEAGQVRRQLQEECEQMRSQTINEVNQMRRQAQKDLDILHQRVTGEVQDMQRGADEYSDRVLGNLESQLIDMIKIVQNGRKELRL